jgi:hypothetical protein
LFPHKCRIDFIVFHVWIQREDLGRRGGNEKRPSGLRVNRPFEAQGKPSRLPSKLGASR